MKAKTCEEKVLQLLETEEQKNEALTEEVASLKEQLSDEKALTEKMTKFLVKLGVTVKRPSAENHSFSAYIHSDDYIWDHGDDEFKEFEQLINQIMPKEEN